MGDCVVAFTIKRNARADESVEDDAEAPDVGLEVAWLHLAHFRGHKEDCACEFPYGRSSLQRCGNSKVGDFDIWYVFLDAHQDI